MWAMHMPMSLHKSILDIVLSKNTSINELIISTITRIKHISGYRHCMVLSPEMTLLGRTRSRIEVKYLPCQNTNQPVVQRKRVQRPLSCYFVDKEYEAFREQSVQD